MSALDDKLAALTAAVADNTAATTAAVSAMQAGSVSPAQLAAVDNATSQLVQATAALRAATPAV